MQLSYAEYFLRFKHPFRISAGIRRGTDCVIVKLSENGCHGYGEATLPPYLSENTGSVVSFLKRLDLSEFSLPDKLESAIRYIHSFHGNAAARCAVESALLHLVSKIKGKSIATLLQLDEKESPDCTFTLGISNEEEMKEKIAAAAGFNIIKIKLDGKNDRTVIEKIRKHTPKPLCVDVNQGWNDVEYAIEMSRWMKTMGVILIEQPFGKNRYDLHKSLTANSPLPIVADESVQTPGDLEKYQDCFSGVNIKLLKCGGLSEAKKIAEFAKSKNLFVLAGCMSESSCGIYHASHLAGYADLFDLDGPFLVDNDPFIPTQVKSGKIICSAPELTLKLNFSTP